MPRKSRRRSTPTKKSCSRQRNKSRSRPRKSRSVAERKKSRSRSRRHLRGGLLSPHQQQEQTAARGKRVSPGDWVAGTAAVLGTGAGLYALQQRRHALQAEQARKTALSAKEEAEKAQKEAERARDEAQTEREKAVKARTFASLKNAATRILSEKKAEVAKGEAQRATEEAQRATARANAADQRATEAERRATEAERRASEAERRATEAERRATEATHASAATEEKVGQIGHTASETEKRLANTQDQLLRLTRRFTEEQHNYKKTLQGLTLNELKVLRRIVLQKITLFVTKENIQQPETPSILGTGLMALGGTLGSFFTGTTETSMNINEHEFPTTVLNQDAFDTFLLQKKSFIEKITQLITQLRQGKKYLRYDILAYACKLNAIDVELLKKECENVITNDEIKQQFIESIKRIMDYNIPNDTFFTPLLVAFDENYSTENLRRQLDIERPRGVR